MLNKLDFFWRWLTYYFGRWFYFVVVCGASYIFGVNDAFLYGDKLPVYWSILALTLIFLSFERFIEFINEAF
jgi:hypothetical protein